MLEVIHLILTMLLMIPFSFIILFELIVGIIFLSTETTLIFILFLIFVNIFSKNKASIIYSVLFMISAYINSYFLEDMLPSDGLYGGGSIIGLIIMLISIGFIIYFTIKIFRTVFGIEKEVTESTENVENENTKELPVIETTPEQIDILRQSVTNIINETEHTIHGKKKK